MSNMIISTNLAALNGHRNMKRVANNMTKAAEKLSSGLRINSAADDAAGLAITEKLRGQIKGLDRAELNSWDGISLIETADGALNEVTAMCIRIRELAVYAANDTNTYEDRLKIQEEIAQLTSEVNALFEDTEFNKKRLFSGVAEGTYRYEYGLREDPSWEPKFPAIIRASEPFQAGRIPRGTQAQRNVSGASYTNITTTAQEDSTVGIGSSHLAFLDSDSFPKEGQFVIQVQDPSINGGNPKGFSLNFGTTPINSVAEFVQYFQDAFDTEFGLVGVPPEQPVTITVDPAGKIDVQTHGLGGTGSSVVIGATVGDGVISGLKIVNSSIFGYSATNSPAAQSYRVATNRIISRAELASITAPATDALLWSLVPDGTVFSWTLQRDTWNTNGYWNDNWNTIDSFSITKSDLNALGATTFASASAITQARASANGLFGSFTINSPSIFTDRNGQGYINFSMGSTQPPNVARSTRYQVLTSPVGSSAFNAAAVSISTASTYNAIVSDKIGLLTINITNVPVSASETKTRTLPIDFSDSSWDGKTAADIVDYINLNINLLPAWRPISYLDPDATNYFFKNAAYDNSRSVATASINAAGQLVITAAERSFGIDIQERLSDRPMFLPGSYSITGTNYSPYIEVLNDDYAPTRIYFTGGDYNTLDEFLAVNKGDGNFRFSNEGGKLVITSVRTGKEVTVSDVNVGANYAGTHNWNGVGGVIEILGLYDVSNSLADKSPYYTDGRTDPPQPVSDHSLWIQTGANSFQGLTLNIPKLNAQKIGLMLTEQNRADGEFRVGAQAADSISNHVGYGFDSYFGTANVPIMEDGFYSNGYSLDVTDFKKAGAAMPILDNALGIITTERAKLGAIQNRLEYTIESLGISSLNLSASMSRIRDADMAKEMMNETKSKILFQAGAAMLAQSNSAPQNVMELIR